MAHSPGQRLITDPRQAAAEQTASDALKRNSFQLFDCRHPGRCFRPFSPSPPPLSPIAFAVRSFGNFPSLTANATRERGERPTRLPLA
jgi:hypothetical protein